MVKLLSICVAFWLLLGCNQNSSLYQGGVTNNYSLAQKKLTRLSKSLQDNQYSEVNDLAKKETQQSYLDSIKALLTDSFHYVLPNFKVTVYNIDVVDFGNKKAFTAKFHDNDKSGVQSVTTNEYWMEFDYSKDSIKALQNNPAYKLLKGLPKNCDTTLSFFYLGETEADIITHQLRLRVVPFPKDYNFDSSRKANAVKRKSSKH